jgi:hypothetical protein
MDWFCNNCVYFYFLRLSINGSKDNYNLGRSYYLSLIYDYILGIILLLLRFD